MKLEQQSNANKALLRKEFKQKRKEVENKEILDLEIFYYLVNSKQYISAKTILFYFSCSGEVDTIKLIEYSLLNDKKVALPYCVDKSGNMEFYLINSNNDLIDGTFGIKEPDISKCKKLNNFDDSIIIVPGLSFDKKGYRLGYGKGYYDRFLKNHSLISVGLCYNIFIVNRLPINEYDRKVDFIISENGLLIT